MPFWQKKKEKIEGGNNSNDNSFSCPRGLAFSQPRFALVITEECVSELLNFTSHFFV